MLDIGLEVPLSTLLGLSLIIVMLSDSEISDFALLSSYLTASISLCEKEFVFGKFVLCLIAACFKALLLVCADFFL